jgi:hypothetical protein
MIDHEDILQQNTMLKELVEEYPDLAHFHVVGVILQDYINALQLNRENEENPIYSSYTICLFFVIADRYKLMWSYCQ